MEESALTTKGLSHVVVLIRPDQLQLLSTEFTVSIGLCLLEGTKGFSVAHLLVYHRPTRSRGYTYMVLGSP